MNENITENMEELEEQLDGMEGTAGEEEAGEANGEISEDVEQTDETSTELDGEEQQSEESGESTALPSEELELLVEKVEEMHTYLAERDMSIFEKPLSKYTATEGLLLIVVLILTAEMIFKKIGGILRCEKE